MAGALMLWAARVIPFVLLGIIGYVSWVVTYTVVVDQYLNPGFLGQSNEGAGIALLTIYWTLTTLVVTTFARLLWTNNCNAGFLEKSQSKPTLTETASAVFSDRSSSNDTFSAISTKISGKLNHSRLAKSYTSPRLSDVLAMDVFVCQPSGLPRWCPTCRIWRPDRSRHSREKDRCVLKLDHFCPWVGGIVAETSMKFFIQFNSCTFLYTIFDWVLAAVCIARSKSAGVAVNGNWIAMLVLGLFFMGLTGGIGLSAIINAITNHTTIENTAEPAGHRWHLALRVRPGEKVGSDVRTVTFPAWTDGDAEELKAFFNQDLHAVPASTSPPATASPPDSQRSTLVDEPAQACILGPTFVIVESDPFSNPWDLGHSLNWRQVMGRNIWDWFLPFQTGGAWFSYEAWSEARGGRRGSDAGAPRSFFPTGADVEMLRAKAGLRTLDEGEDAKYQRRMAERRKFPYLLGGAGAPRKQWAASFGKPAAGRAGTG